MLPRILEFFSHEKTLILASQSPQRKRILELFEIPFRTVPSGHEEIVDRALAPEKNCENLAFQKASAVFSMLSEEEKKNSVVVGVDTIVVSEEGEILEKPKDREDARRMISQKSGTIEKVISGICVLSEEKKLIRHEVAEISFLDFSEEDVETILDQNEWQGNSGAVCVEGKSSFYISSLSGNFWNIVGFPIVTFGEMMEEMFHFEKR